MRRARGRAGWLAGLIVAAVLAGGCGTRLPDSAFESQGEGAGRSVRAGATRQATSDGAVTDDGAAGTDQAAAPGAAGDPGSNPTPGGAGPTDAPASGPGGPGGGPGGGGPAGPNTASDVGVTPTEIKIGNITAVNGSLGDAFAPSQRGLQAFVSYINAKGGVNGRKITLVTCDDREDRARDQQCAQKLVEQDKVFAFLANNSRAEGGGAPYINSKGVPAVYDIPITNASYRFPHYWTIYGSGYPRDGKTVGWKGKLVNTTGIYRWFKQNMGVKKAAVFSYAAIKESEQAAAFMARGLELEGFAVTRYSINFANPTFDQPVLTMQRDGTDILFDALDDGANRKLCDAMQRYGLKVKAKVSTVVAYGDTVGKDFAEVCRNITFIGGDTASYSDLSNPAVKEFRDAYARYKPGAEVRQWALEGWMAGKAFVEAVKSMGPNVTRKGLEDWLRGLKDYQNGGLSTPIDHQPRNYDAPTTVDCFTIAQWQDSAKGWVQRAGINNCINDAKQFATDPAEQGD